MVPVNAGAKIASKGDEEKQTVIFGYSDGPGEGTKSSAGLIKRYVTLPKMSSAYSRISP